MRKALVVGIDYYLAGSSLHGCVNDAHLVKAVLERNADGTVNFDVRLLAATGPNEIVERATLKHQVRELFEGDNEIALFYYAGHGHIEDTGGYLVASDAKTGDDGLALGDVLTFARNSPAKNKIIILDSCHSGIAGNAAATPTTADLKEGTTILTASTAEQYATEKNGAGVFTSLLVDALGGAAASLTGDITPGSVYAHIDRSLGPWAQRPVFKTNVKTFVSLRKVQPPIDLADLHRLTEFFPPPETHFQLDPSFEPVRNPGEAGIPPPNPQNTPRFAVLQKYNRVNLVVPDGATHMYFAAMESKSCKLTALGEHYRRLVADGRI
jgi:hypothetical protein